MLVPDRQPEKVKLIQQFAPLLAPVRVGAATALDPAALRAPLETLRRRLRLASRRGATRPAARSQPVLAKLDAVLDKLGRPDSAGPGPRSSSSRGRSRATSPTSSRAFRRT